MANLIRLADKMTKLSDGIACALYEMILEKMLVIDCAELTKCEVKYSFGKFLVKTKDYEKANKILKEALQRSDENNVSTVIICHAPAFIFSFASLKSFLVKYVTYTMNRYIIHAWTYIPSIKIWQFNWLMIQNTLLWKVLLIALLNEQPLQPATH